MSILRTTYDSYVLIMEMAKKRMKRDRQIIKIVSKMINTKYLSDSEQHKINDLLKDK